MTRWYFLALLFLSGFVVVHAQSPAPTATLSGTVLDQSGAVVSGAQTTLKGGEQFQSVSIMTDATGKFRFERQGGGNYEIIVTREGFKSTTVRVAIGNRPITSLSIVLPVDDVQQEITVTDSNNGVNTEAGGNIDVVSMNREALNNLPTLDQDYVATMSRFLSAGAVGTGGVTLVVDGMEASKLGVSASAIQELKINNNPYSAEYSRPGRGRIEVMTKPGTAQFHGEFNFLFRDHHLNARDPFANTRPPEQRRIFEGNLTGPLIRSKVNPTSFLFSFEREEDDLQSIVFATGPRGPIQTVYPRPERDLELSFRITRQMTGRSTFSVLYEYEKESVRNEGVGGFNLPEVAAHSRNREDLLRFSHNWVISPRLIHQISVLLGRYDTPTVSANQSQRIVVQDTFTGGGAQADYLRTEAHWTLNQTLIYTRGKHVIRGGIQVPDFSRRGINDRTNGAGTFYFSSLQDYLQSRPFSFIRQQGLTKVVFTDSTCSAR